jgi:uncharacterized membrane protein
MADAERSPSPGQGPGSNVLVSFGPWIAVWMLTGNHSFIPGLLIATCVSIGLIVWSYASGDRPKLLDWGTLAALAVLSVVAVVSEDAWLGYWLSPLLNAALLLIMVVTLLAGHPFTEDYAKAESPPETWDTPEFKHINLVLTWAWIGAVAAMLVGSTVSALVRSGDVTTASAHSVEGFGNWGVTVIALVAVFKFTAWYPDTYLARVQGTDAGLVGE